jgi:hypothetical protein
MKTGMLKAVAVRAILGVILSGAARGNLWDYYIIIQAGGKVQDVSRIENETQQYVQNLNKLNLTSSANSSAEQKFVAWQAMEKTFGDGRGVPACVPNQIAASPEIRQEIDRYVASLPSTPEGACLQGYLQRQQQRDQVIQAYSARLRAQALATGQSSLTLGQCAAVGNSLANLGYDNRLLQINEAAETDSIRSMMREDQLKMREYRLSRQESDAAWAQK